jgi:hypothetical protein
LDASGINGLVIDNLSVTRLSPAASTQPLGFYFNMRKALLVFGIFTLLLIVRVEAVACTCDAPSPTKTTGQLVSEALIDAEAVFTGKVLSIHGTRPLRVVFLVEGSWKGKVPSKVVISTGRGDGDCGYRFVIGRRYLVYAGPATFTRWGTSICHRTGTLSDRADDLPVLGEPKRSFRQRAYLRLTKPNKSLDASGGSVFRN